MSEGNVARLTCSARNVRNRLSTYLKAMKPSMTDINDVLIVMPVTMMENRTSGGCDLGVEGSGFNQAAPVSVLASESVWIWGSKFQPVWELLMGYGSEA